MNCLSCNIQFKSKEQKLQCFYCKKWQHRRCFSWKDPSDYARMKRCFSFKCSDCSLPKIENIVPSNAVPLVSDGNNAGDTLLSISSFKRPSTLIPLHCHQQRSIPAIFSPPPIISPILSPTLVPTRINSPLTSPVLNQSLEKYLFEILEFESNPDLDFIFSSKQPDSPTPGTSNERSNTQKPDHSNPNDALQNAKDSAPSLSPVDNFRIIKGASIMGNDILLDGSGFRFGVKRRNELSGVVTWLCNHRGVKGKKSCCATVKELNGVYTKGPSPHCH